MRMVTVTEVYDGSHAARLGIRPSDALVSINGNPIRDVLDYRFYMTERSLEIRLLRDGEELCLRLRKGEYDDLGLGFETPLMDQKHTCRNKCVFCFIDQLPKGLRKTLYFKDDDSRLSFLHGSYVTLTNLTDEDIDRIIKMRLSPVNISVHTTDPDLRVRMMKNPRAGEVLGYLRRLADAGIALRTQIVLCRGVNDGEALLRSLRDLSALYPALESCSVVPAGLTRYREGLYPLSPYTPEECRDIIRTVEEFAADCRARLGSYIFHLGDELYTKAGLPLPSEQRYEDYPQIENGVGMITSLSDEFASEMPYADAPTADRRVSFATGLAAYPTLRALADRLREVFPRLTVLGYPVENDFFGHTITVAGLLTGKDLLAKLKGKDLGDELLIPRCALRNEGDLFLCGMHVDELSRALGVPVRPVGNDGYEFLHALLGDGQET